MFVELTTWLLGIADNEVETNFACPAVSAAPCFLPNRRETTGAARNANTTPTSSVTGQAENAHAGNSQTYPCMYVLVAKFSPWFA